MGHEGVALGLSVSRECYARLAYSYYPELRVRIDGRETTVRETADHYLLVRLPAGRHHLLIEPRMTPLRLVTRTVSVAALILVLAAAVGAALIRRFRN
jgi:hypothetical protein